jgi:hypothetical protein
VKIVHQGVSYLLWVVTFLFGLWLIYLCRTTWLAGMGFWFIQGSPTRAQQAGFLDKVFLLILGFSWLILMVASEAYYRKGVKNRQLLTRFAKVSGPILLSVFVIDAILAWITGLAIIGWIRLVVILVELAAGILFIRFGWRNIILEKRGNG